MHNVLMPLPPPVPVVPRSLFALLALSLSLSLSLACCSPISTHIYGTGRFGGNEVWR